MATAAVVEQAQRAGIETLVEPVPSAVPVDAALARNALLNSCVPEGGCGYPLHPELQGLQYPAYGMHRQSMSKRLSYEEKMLDWVAVGESYGYTDEQSMLFSLYL
jgi:hypothetical protein